MYFFFLNFNYGLKRSLTYTFFCRMGFTVTSPWSDFLRQAKMKNSISIANFEIFHESFLGNIIQDNVPVYILKFFNSIDIRTLQNVLSEQIPLFNVLCIPRLLVYEAVSS